MLQLRVPTGIEYGMKAANEYLAGSEVFARSTSHADDRRLAHELSKNYDEYIRKRL